MPIRSPHGRSAAYRAIWQWPLHSPGRLAVTVLVALALVAAASYGLGAVRGARDRSGGGLLGVPAATAQPGTPTAPDSAGSSPAPTALPPVQELTPAALPLSAASPEGLRVVTAWAAAWVRPPAGTTSVQWLAGLRPYTTDEYLGVLAGVDPANVPSTRVTGTVRPVEVAARSMRVQVPTDALTLLVTVVDTGAGWRVSGYERA